MKLFQSPATGRHPTFPHAACSFRGDGNLLSAHMRCPDGHLIYLVVEAMPSGAWDWTVWHASAPEISHYGTANTAAEATACAEATAVKVMVSDGLAHQGAPSRPDRSRAFAALGGGVSPESRYRSAAEHPVG